MILEDLQLKNINNNPLYNFNFLDYYTKQKGENSILDVPLGSEYPYEK